MAGAEVDPSWLDGRGGCGRGWGSTSQAVRDSSLDAVEESLEEVLHQGVVLADVPEEQPALDLRAGAAVSSYTWRAGQVGGGGGPSRRMSALRGRHDTRRM